MENNIISNHIFIFPFQWRTPSKKGDLNPSLKETSNLKTIEKAIDPYYWENFEFDYKVEENFNTFNDYSYFYPPIRDILNLEPKDAILTGLQYQYKNIGPSSKYLIHIINEKVLELNLTDITLSFYENGVGIFSLHLNNTKESNFDRILKINEYGRRIYPQFLGVAYNNYTEATKFNFLSNKIELRNVPSIELNIVEDFSFYNNLNNIKRSFFNLPKHISALMGSNFTGDLNLKNKIIIQPILDDRMFVITHLFSQEKIIQLKKYKEGEYNYQNSKDWYRYLYIDDSNASCTSRNMLNKQLTEQSYDRWIENKGSNFEINAQLFGVTRYSFMLISGEDFFNRNIISKHIQNMYFEMVMLCLIQRSYTISFGNEIARIAKRLGNENESLSESRKDISALYLQYIRFVNRIYFREVSPQEQGIELYDLLQKTLRIGTQVEDLAKEMQELNNYVETIEQSNLSKVANWFLPVSLLVGILALSSLKNLRFNQLNFSNINFWETAINMATIIVLIWTSVILYKQFKNKLKYKLKTLWK